MTASSEPGRAERAAIVCRLFAWSIVALTFAFLVNNYLTHWQGWPGASHVTNGFMPLAWLQAVLYVLAFGMALAYILRTPAARLRPDSERLYALTNYIVRGAFWGVLLIGLADIVISFLRVEELIVGAVGDQLATDLGRSSFRGAYVHLPLLLLGYVIAIFASGLGFPWLALLVVIAELLIVFARFVFSYEQAFMADLVRFWYAALFLFASAYTLIEEGHVRVDVLYSGFSERTKGMVNAIGSVLLGLPVCVVIIAIGMGGRSAIINGPLLIFEVTQAGFGMYVKYWMAGFLGVFAVTMLIQFAGFFLEGIADYRGEPGKREVSPMGA